MIEMDKETKLLQRAFMDVSSDCDGVAAPYSTMNKNPLRTQLIQANLQKINQDVAKMPKTYADPKNQRDFADFKREVTDIYKCVNRNQPRYLPKISKEMVGHITNAYVDEYFSLV